MYTTSLHQQAASIFEEAARYIETYGWQRSGMSEHGKPRCSMGTLASAWPKQQWDKTLATLMYEALSKELQGTTLTAFNYRASSGKDVASLFRRVARSLQ